MSLRFVGIDPDTDYDHCPTVWADAEAGELVIQGWKAGAALKTTCEADTPANGRIPDSEVSAAVSRGISIRRARVVSEPVSEYIRWEYDATPGNIIAGEEVRWLSRRHATDVLLPSNDFWLFDSALLRVHHFAGDGGLVEDELTDDPGTLKICAAAFEEVWQRATPHDRFTI